MDVQLRERQLAGVTASHRALEAMLDDLAADGSLDAAAQSLLPGWTVGHVLTHVARNADSMTWVLGAAERGEVAERYPGGLAQRNGDIDDGAGRPAVEQLADIKASNERLDTAFATHTNWDGKSNENMVGNFIPVSELLFIRWREVEVHRADLGLGYGPADWPAEYARTELRALENRWRGQQPMGITGLPSAALAAPEHVRVAWLLGRATIEGLEPAGIF